MTFLWLLLFIFTCMFYVCCVCAGMHAHVLICIQRKTLGVFLYCSLPCFPETESLIEPELHLPGSACLFSPTLGLWAGMPCWMPMLVLGIHSSSHTGTDSALAHQVIFPTLVSGWPCCRAPHLNCLHSLSLESHFFSDCSMRVRHWRLLVLPFAAPLSQSGVIAHLISLSSHGSHPPAASCL